MFCELSRFRKLINLEAHVLKVIIHRYFRKLRIFNIRKKPTLKRIENSGRIFNYTQKLSTKQFPTFMLLILFSLRLIIMEFIVKCSATNKHFVSCLLSIKGTCALETLKGSEDV